MSTVINYFFDSFLTISVVIFVVLLVRGIFFRKLPKRFAYLLWAVVGLRLLCPVSLPSSISVFNALPSPRIFAEKASPRALAEPLFSQSISNPGTNNEKSSSHTENSDLDSGFSAKNTEKTPFSKSQAAKSNTFSTSSTDISGVSPEKNASNSKNLGIKSGNSGEEILSPGTKALLNHNETDSAFTLILFTVWLLGFLLFIGRNCLAALRLHKELATAVLLKDNIYESDRIATPFVKGIVRPKIYIPFRLSETEKRYILAHEQYHIKRRDPFFKLLATLLLGIYWFHPLVWIAFKRMTQDMEMSCDEYVLSTQGEDIRKLYSNLLLSFAVDKSAARGALCFGEHNTRLRISHILKYKKTGVPASICAILLILLVSGCTLTTSSGKEQAPADTSASEKYDGTWLKVTEPRFAITDPVFTTPKFLYADAKKIIFTVNGGLYAFNKKDDCFILTASLDLTSIHCENTYETDYGRNLEMAATKDGAQVWMHRTSDSSAYIFDVEQNGLLQFDYKKEYFDKLEKFDSFAVLSSDPRKGARFTDETGRTISAFLSVQGRGNQLGQLCYCEVSSLDEPWSTKPLFLDIGGLTYGKATDLTPGKLHGLQTVSFFHEGSMRKYEIDDPKIMKAFTDCINNSKPVKGGGGCPFTMPLYLTLDDGTMKVIYPALDSCPGFIADGVEYETPKDESLGVILGGGKDIFAKTLVYIKEDVGISSSDQWGFSLNAVSDEYLGDYHFAFSPDAKIYAPDTYGYKELSRKEFSDYVKAHKNALDGYTIYTIDDRKCCVRVVIKPES